VGFEPTIPAFERAKTFHALDRAAIVTGSRHVWEKDIKTDIIKIACNDWVFIAQYRDQLNALLNTVTNVRVT
jgi:hypothetical protein